jgi:guanylate kinase
MSPEQINARNRSSASLLDERLQQLPLRSIHSLNLQPLPPRQQLHSFLYSSSPTTSNHGSHWYTNNHTPHP